MLHSYCKILSVDLSKYMSTILRTMPFKNVIAAQKIYLQEMKRKNAKSVNDMFDRILKIIVQGAYKHISFHKLISMRISVQISYHFDSMFSNRSKFEVFIFTDIEMPFAEGEMALVCWSMLDHSRTRLSSMNL